MTAFKLLTIDEVAAELKLSPRSVRRLNDLPYSKIGGSRRYDLRDVEAYHKDHLQCQSSSAKGVRTTTRSSKSKALGFFEALNAAPNAKPALQKSV
jgi:hypothetical protein